MVGNSQTVAVVGDDGTVHTMQTTTAIIRELVERGTAVVIIEDSPPTASCYDSLYAIAALAASDFDFDYRTLRRMSDEAEMRDKWKFQRHGHDFHQRKWSNDKPRRR